MSPTSYTLTPGDSSTTTSSSSPYTNTPPQSYPSNLIHQYHHQEGSQIVRDGKREQSKDLSQHQHQAHQHNNDGSSQQPQPQRSRDGCLTCRSRKVKCNEERPICDKCRIKSRECLWPSGDESERRRNKKRRVTGTPDDIDSVSNISINGNSNGTNSDKKGNRTIKSKSSNRQSSVDIKPAPTAHQTSSSHKKVQPQSQSQPPLHIPNIESSSSTSIRPNSIKLPPIQPYPTNPYPHSHMNSHTMDPNYLRQPSFHPPPPHALIAPSHTPSSALAPPAPSTSFNYHRHHNHAKSTIPVRRIKGIVHIPPGFLPPDVLNGNSSTPNGKNREKGDGLGGDLNDWLVPEKARAGMMMDPSFLEPYFPTVDERLVLRHYLSKTVHIIIAFESNHHPWNPWISIHTPLAFKHLPGTNPAADALRAAMLAVGGVHLTYTTNPTDQAAAWRITKSAKTKVLNLIKQTLQDENGEPRVLEKENIELVLAALLSCTIASSLAADDSWHHLLSSVLSLIDQLGGAQNILQDAPRNRLSPYRFFMEQLAIRDVFGCMTTELAPSILQDAFTPWFFEAEGWSRSDFEWESVERMFGISRGMVDMIARACNLIASVRALNQHLPELALPNLDPSLLSLHKASSELMAELKIWDEAENFTPLHPRTQYGNHSYKHAIRIRMLRKVYNIPSEDERVKKSSQAIIELAGEMLALYGKITWLTWPILIAGFEIPPSHPSRRTALEMLGAFGPHACFDNRAAARMLSDYWMWHDMDGDHATSWEVARTLNQRPFLD